MCNQWCWYIKQEIIESIPLLELWFGVWVHVIYSYYLKRSYSALSELLLVILLGIAKLYYYLLEAYTILILCIVVDT